jgi:hypothetical protein
MPAWRKRHLARTCPTYAPIWAGDVRVKMFAALRGYADWYSQVGFCQVRMVTVTAPGVKEGLPWDEDHCRHLGEHRHDGRLGCRTLPAAAGLFNRLAPAWWSELHRQARQAASRSGLIAPELLSRVWEKQARGVLHLHLVVGYTIPAERAAADRYVAELSTRAPRHGFGFVDRKVEVKEPTQAAAYLSSYFVNGSGRKKALSETVQDRSMPRSIIYVATWLSKRSGITMRSLRLRRYAWQIWRLDLEPQGLGLEVQVLDVWQGLLEGLTLMEIVSGCL